MSEIKKITEEELTSVNKYQAELAQLLQDIGVAEARKHALLHSIVSVNASQEKIKKELEEKYGPININLETGEYTLIEAKNE
jgi:predicted  nucleic acid-binding Zn-ribbon protein